MPLKNGALDQRVLEYYKEHGRLLPEVKAMRGDLIGELIGSNMPEPLNKLLREQKWANCDM
jgi:hypothetical protein